MDQLNLESNVNSAVSRMVDIDERILMGNLVIKNNKKDLLNSEIILISNNNQRYSVIISSSKKDEVNPMLEEINSKNLLKYCLQNRTSHTSCDSNKLSFIDLSDNQMYRDDKDGMFSLAIKIAEQIKAFESDNCCV